MIKEHLDTQLNDEKANHRKKVFQLDTRNEQMRKKDLFHVADIIRDEMWSELFIKF